MSKFKPGDKVVVINVDHYSDIMKQLMGKALVVNSIDTDKCGCEIVCARVPGEEGWFLYSDDLRLVSEAQMPKSSEVWVERWGGCGYLNPYADTSPTNPTDPAPAAAQKPLRRGDLVEYDGRVCVVAENDIEGGVCSVAALTGEHGYDHVPTDELKHIGSIRKKVKRLKAAIAKAGGES